MKILFYDTKSYDKESFEATLKKFPGIQIDYIRSDLDPRTAALADGFDAVCAFVSSNVSEATLKILHEKGVRLVLLRCAGYNNVDLEKASEYDICVMRVPGYSPEAVAEHAMALALACNRRLYKAYNKVREMISASPDSWASISMVRLPESSEPAGSVQLCAGSVTVSA